MEGTSGVKKTKEGNSLLWGVFPGGDKFDSYKGNNSYYKGVANSFGQNAGMEDRKLSQGSHLEITAAAAAAESSLLVFDLSPKIV